MLAITGKGFLKSCPRGLHPLPCFLQSFGQPSEHFEGYKATLKLGRPWK